MEFFFYWNHACGGMCKPDLFCHPRKEGRQDVMIYLELLLAFLEVGMFSFGGAYGAIPLIRDVVLSHGWLTDETLTYMIAVSESTPGPIMVNTATYIGNEVGGILGSMLATFMVCLPAFIIILLFSMIFKTFLKKPFVAAILDGIKPCIIGIIAATGLHMIITNCIAQGLNISANWQTLLITALLFVVMVVYKKLRKKSISPIMLIGVSACFGMIFFA